MLTDASRLDGNKKKFESHEGQKEQAGQTTFSGGFRGVREIVSG